VSSTFPSRLKELATARPGAVALQHKRHGIWHSITWSGYASHVRELAHGLAGLGVGRGDVVGIISDNRPEWLIGELAAQCLGAAVVGVDPARGGDDTRDIVALAGARVVIAEDQEQVDKLLPRDGRAELAHIIYCDPRGLAPYRGCLASFADVAAAGRRDADARPGWLDAEIAAGDAEDIAVLGAPETAAASEKPELARFSHARLFAMAEQIHPVDPRTRPPRPLRAAQRYVSFLPLAWIGEQRFAVGFCLAHELTVAFPEDAATERADLREIGPDVLFGPPPIWDSLRSSAQARVGDADWLKRRVFAWAYRVGEAVADCRVRGERPGLRLAAAHRIADAIGLGPVRDQLGLSRIQHGYAGGAVPPEVLRFFHAIGVDLTQIDASSEGGATEAAR
jgi:long-chain acyl-CoA synthetase